MYLPAITTVDGEDRQCSVKGTCSQVPMKAFAKVMVCPFCQKNLVCAFKNTMMCLSINTSFNMSAKQVPPLSFLLFLVNKTLML